MKPVAVGVTEAGGRSPIPREQTASTALSIVSVDCGSSVVKLLSFSREFGHLFQLGPRASTVGGTSSIPGQGTEIRYATQPKKKKKISNELKIF